MQVHEYFRLPEKKALSIIKEVKNAVSEWKVVAKNYGLSKREIELKARAFQNF